MIPTDPILSSVTAAAGCSLILDVVQKSKVFPWITSHTRQINLAAKLIMSGMAEIGIAHAWAPSATGGGTFTITIPAFSVILVGAYHWFGQFALQHGFGQILTIGTLQKIDAPVEVTQDKSAPTPSPTS